MRGVTAMGNGGAVVLLCMVVVGASAMGSASAALGHPGALKGGHTAKMDPMSIFADAPEPSTMDPDMIQNGFATMDTDRDNSLSSDEMKQHFSSTAVKKRLGENGIFDQRMSGVSVFMNADKDMDLQVDAEEWAHWCQQELEHGERLQTLWTAMDKNKNDRVIFAEYKAAHSKELKDEDEEIEFKRISEGEDFFTRAQFISYFSTDAFNSADKDLSGFLDKEELKSVIGHEHFADVLSPEEQATDLQHTFEEYDLNKDGKVSEEELNEHALAELKHGLGAANVDLQGDEHLEAALTGDDVDDPHGAADAPVEEEDTGDLSEHDELTEQETAELMGEDGL